MAEKALTRDWDTTIPADHTKFKAQPGHVRDLRTDLEDRLEDILAGFTAGETYVGIKLGDFLTYGTGDPTTPAGTGNALNFILYAKTKDYLTGPTTQAEMFGIDQAGNVIQITKSGKLCLDNARLLNNTWLLARNSGNSADVNLYRLTTNNYLELGTTLAAHPLGPDTSHSADTEYITKGYADQKVAKPSSPSAGDVLMYTNSEWAAQSNIPRVKTGTYNGDGGASQAITGIGFQPKFLIVYAQYHSGSYHRFWKTDQDGLYAHSNSGDYQTGIISSLDADGFTVGNVQNVNISGRTYTYVAFS